jgi:hypothetical protein
MSRRRAAGLQVHNPGNRRHSIIRKSELHRNPVIIHIRVGISIGQPNLRWIEVSPMPQHPSGSLTPGRAGGS